MCGRYTGYTEEQESDMIDAIRAAAAAVFAARTYGDFAPTDYSPVLLDVREKPRAAVMKWGFPGYPNRDKPDAKPPPLFNAKAETALTLATWRDSAERRRCVVPSGGFYEWSHDGERTKYLFTTPGENGLFMAAIYKDFELPDGDTVPHFAILTTAANESVSDVHSRMPVVLRRGELDTWLRGDYRRLLDRSEVALLKIAV